MLRVAYRFYITTTQSDYMDVGSADHGCGPSDSCRSRTTMRRSVPDRASAASNSACESLPLLEPTHRVASFRHRCRLVVDVLTGFVPSSSRGCAKGNASATRRVNASSCVLSMAGAQRERLRLCDPALSCGEELDQWARLGVLAMTCECRPSCGGALCWRLGLGYVDA